MENFLESLTGLVAVVCSLGIPIVVVIMVFLRKMKKDNQAKEIRQLIIENKTDPETAKLLVDEPKPQKKEQRKLGAVNLESLRTACILLGIGLGALINWVCKSCGQEMDTIYFWLIIAFGIGIGMLCSFLVEMHLFKKYGNDEPKDEQSDNAE